MYKQTSDLKSKKRLFFSLTQDKWSLNTEEQCKRGNKFFNRFDLIKKIQTNFLFRIYSFKQINFFF